MRLTPLGFCDSTCYRGDSWLFLEFISNLKGVVNEVVVCWNMFWMGYFEGIFASKLKFDVVVT